MQMLNQANDCTNQPHVVALDVRASALADGGYSVSLAIDASPARVGNFESLEVCAGHIARLCAAMLAEKPEGGRTKFDFHVEVSDEHGDNIEAAERFFDAIERRLDHHPLDR